MWEGDYYSGTKSEKKSISRLVETKILNTTVHRANSCKATFGDWLKHTTEKQNTFLAAKREKNRELIKTFLPGISALWIHNASSLGWHTWQDLTSPRFIQRRGRKYCLFIRTRLAIKTWEKAMATHSSTLAWKIPWTEEPGGLQSMGLRRVGHN